MKYFNYKAKSENENVESKLYAPVYTNILKRTWKTILV